MSRKIAVINIVFAIGDMLVAICGILAFSYIAVYFGKWWIVLLTLIPLILFSGHSVIIDADIERAKLEEEEGDCDT